MVVGFVIGLLIGAFLGVSFMTILVVGRDISIEDEPKNNLEQETQNDNKEQLNKTDKI